MRFGYSYKTPDAVWHEDEIDAKDRESVFQSLKSKGVRPIKVWEKERRPASKRWIAIGVLSALVVILAVSLARTRRMVADAAVGSAEIADSSIRHFIPGLSLSADNLARLFAHPSERCLALYAFPGEAVQTPEFSDTLAADFADAMNLPVLLSAADTEAERELRRIVAGMKEELVRYTRIGGGVRDYLRMLDARQKSEVAHRERTVSEYERKAKSATAEESAVLVEKADESLRVMGMRAIREK